MCRGYWSHSRCDINLPLFTCREHFQFMWPPWWQFRQQLTHCGTHHYQVWNCNWSLLFNRCSYLSTYWSEFDGICVVRKLIVCLSHWCSMYKQTIGYKQWEKVFIWQHIIKHVSNCMTNEAHINIVLLKVHN